MNQEFVNRVSGLIEANIDEKLNGDFLAKKLNISRMSLHRYIKIKVGMNAESYINHIRIEKAKSFLLSSQLKVKIIALKVGYQNSSYFSKVFKKMTNYTPKEYRQKFQGYLYK